MGNMGNNLAAQPFCRAESVVSVPRSGSLAVHSPSFGSSIWVYFPGWGWCRLVASYN